jgi:uncharacterized membrane protein YhaH (DUF805 family)
MTFAEAIKSCLSKYTTFKGRASRSEFWWFYLAYLLCDIPAALVSAKLSLGYPVPVAIAVLVLRVSLFAPLLAVTARRMHDTDHSAWFMLAPIYNIVLECTGGTSGPNR